MEHRKQFDLLIVDDDDPFRELMIKAFTRRGLSAIGANCVTHAIALCDDIIPSKAILDLRMPGPSGLVLVEFLKNKFPEIQIVILTAFGSIVSTEAAIKQGASAYLIKPCNISDVLAAFEPSSQQSDVPVDFPSIAQVEWDYIQRVLRDCGGNVTRTAQVLNLDRRSLQRRLANPPNLK
ncbi:response regulator transcription factor [Lacipirellula parvula]|uniref:Response regulatory domain-containing protein n=1 Tax=Lacipirellula parvula TaxID=2650471 RepID=A0A5K7XBK5_9BACT|nr:response regulator [Lacipirellula parvula]BBO34180.1 hypothetical protein PLANPX_3792 [Lacipirellula parvula]